MRDFKGMKRQRGRNRNGGGGGGGGGGRPQHNTNRAFDSNGPDGVKVRGAAQHVYEKYQQLARDAHTAGDRVVAENYLQHAEHYFRVMRAMQPLRPLSEIVGRDQFVSGYDIDFEDESLQTEAGGGETETDTRENGADRSDVRRDERPREDFRAAELRGRDDRNQGDRTQNDRFQNDRAQNDRVQSDRVQNDRQGRNFQNERPRYNRDENAPRVERQDRADSDPMSIVEPQPLPIAQTPQAGDRVLRADDGEVNHAPAFLQVRPVEPREGVSGEPRARRRRPVRTSETPGGESAPSEAEEV
jgi:hypothetical protein